MLLWYKALNTFFLLYTILSSSTWFCVREVKVILNPEKFPHYSWNAICAKLLFQLRWCLGVTWFEGGETLDIILPTAAAVFDVGRLVQSPIPNTFEYFLCCRVSLSTSTQPASSTTGLFLRTSGALIGGVTWSISYYKKGEHPNLCFSIYLQPHKLCPRLPHPYTALAAPSTT